MSVRIASDEGTTLANALVLCGHQDWKAGDVKDVTGASQDLTCYSTRVPRHEDTKYRLDAGQLTLENTIFNQK